MTNTLMKAFLIGATAPLLASAQVPPTPPRPASPPVDPAPVVRPTPPVRVYIDPRLDYNFDIQPRLEEVRIRAEESRLHAQELRLNALADANEARESARFKLESSRVELQDQMQFRLQEQRWNAEQMVQNFKFDIGGTIDTRGDKLLNAKPRMPWATEDPADSLYRLARESLNRGEYRRAAQYFNEVTKRFPKSQYALDCAYWEAFSRYRTGTTDDLREALKILEEGKDKFAYLRSGESDVPGLRARVQAALAARGDTKAAKALQDEASQNTTSCDREDVSVRAEALSALGQMDLASAMPVVKKVLARRDECTVELRRRALYLVGRQPNAEAASVLIDVAKNDTDPGIRSEAMSWLSRTAGDQAVPMLEDLLKTSTDERTQRSAVTALGSIDTEKARKAIRAIIERTDVLERVRSEAISSLARDRDNRMMSAEDMQYLRSLYAKMESQRLKETVLSALGRVETAETEQFLLGIARNQAEAPSLRATALNRLGRMQTVSLNDIGKLYEAADSRSMREQILRALLERKEPEAIDKLVEVAKKDTDYNIRRYAIQMLSRSNNPKALQGIRDLAVAEKP